MMNFLTAFIILHKPIKGCKYVTEGWSEELEGEHPWREIMNQAIRKNMRGEGALLYSGLE
jgi:hypothetical protein